jgi:hypothetical protein
MSFLNIPVGSTTTTFDMATGAPRTTSPVQASSQNPPVRQVTQEQDAAVVAQRLALVRAQERVEAERARINNAPSMEAARAWLRGRSAQQALLELYVMFKSLEDQRDG